MGNRRDVKGVSSKISAEIQLIQVGFAFIDSPRKRISTKNTQTRQNLKQQPSIMSSEIPTKSDGTRE